MEALLFRLRSHILRLDRSQLTDNGPLATITVQKSQSGKFDFLCQTSHIAVSGPRGLAAAITSGLPGAGGGVASFRNGSAAANRMAGARNGACGLATRMPEEETESPGEVRN